MRRFCLLACAIVSLSVISPIGGNADAGPFRKWLSCPGGQCQPATPTNPPSIGPAPESKPADPVVVQPWLPNDGTDFTFSPQPDTALEPLDGTGLGSLIGKGKVPDKITHTLDPATIAAIVQALKSSSLPTQPVPITLPVEPSTSERFSRLSSILEVAALLGTALLGHSFLGKLLPLVAQAGAGLLSSAAAASRAANQQATGTYLPPAPQSPAATPAALSSTPTPNT